MKVEIRKFDRTLKDMDEIWRWVTTNFGPPSAHNDNLKRWTYGKDVDWTGSTMCSGTFDIEWFEFTNERDALLYMLRWA